jgi:threonine dehydratase
MIPSEWLDGAARRLHGQIRQTPLVYDPELNLYLKWENRQLTGSFKIRGALNKVLTLEPWELQRGLVTASAGNHGQGVAYAGRLVNARVIVFASVHAVPAKIEAMQRLGAEVRLVEGEYADAEQTAQDFAAANGSTWISPYNDGQVIAGQGTVGLELLSQLEELDPPVFPRSVIVPIGGGGLICGMGMALERLDPRPRLIAAQSTASPYFHELFYNGSQAGVVELQSLADGLAGAVEEMTITIPLVKRWVDEILLVTEDDIARAVAFAWERYEEKIEGSAGAALAVALTGSVSDRPAVVILSGGNIQPEVHAKICQVQGLLSKPSHEKEGLEP